MTIRPMQDDARLPTSLVVMAQVRRCNGAGLPAMVVRKGDATGGAVLVKVNLLGPGVRVFVQARDAAGRLGWMAALGHVVPEVDADAYIAREHRRDPDLWVIEVEDPQGRNPFAA